MQDNLIPFYEDFKIAKEITDMLEDKYGPKFETYIQILLEKYGNLAER